MISCNCQLQGSSPVIEFALCDSSTQRQQSRYKKAMSVHLQLLLSPNKVLWCCLEFKPNKIKFVSF